MPYTYAYTLKWHTDKHAQQPEGRIDFAVKLKSYSLHLKLPAKWGWHINGNAQFTRLQVWMLYQNTSLDALSKHECKPSPAEHIRTRKKLPTHARQPQDHNATVNLVIQIVVYVWLSGSRL